MSKQLVIALSMGLVLGTASCSKYDDSALSGRLSALEGRVQTLENQMKGINADIKTLRDLTTASAQGKTVKSVSEVAEGYKITFSDKQEITLRHGTKGEKGDRGEAGAQGIAGAQGPQGIAGAQGAKGEKGDRGETGAQGIAGPQGPQGIAGAQGAKGEKGDRGEAGAQGIAGPQGPQGIAGSTPTISVKEDAGTYYWQINGAWLMDASGNKLPVTGLRGHDGVTPQLRIAQGKWEVSYNQGQMWQVVEGQPTSMTPEKPMIEGLNLLKSIKETQDMLEITLTSGTVFKLRKEQTPAQPPRIGLGGDPAIGSANEIF